MVNITHKSNTLRKAIAEASVLVSKQETIEAIEQRKVPKGDVFSFAKVAALFGVKKTSEFIPDCHPLPVEFTDVRFNITDLKIIIEVEVHTVYKTGVEVEAMHGASIAALTLYDMLKPIDKNVVIQQIQLKSKTGGKTDKKSYLNKGLQAAVIVCSDTVSANKPEDKAGIAVIEALKKLDIQVPVYKVIPDDSTAIQEQVAANTHEGIQLLIMVGGTGVSLRDITPDTVKPLLDRELDGIMETARRYGQERMPYAMLSRSVAGLINQTLVLTFPGSLSGATEYMDALFPQVLHVLEVIAGDRHGL
ncbi:MAG: bifunctional molybdenum cofactor biosynthesis protein MoaC/MoaB [Sphingobacteriia bacterium 24-36-13]|jgi:molybdenum cofactor biosynthesis protein MoaC|uniref:bifunctional molybdenum cofactor biosynthesis protein MoaC/MoaB n=1 Tax=Sediminibacterium sp. TaxID=1917865 RepID=UPI000BD6B804|nr:bifunctional molybdenum cofactor biosynthesis protein MoaC/MoaB [Sediminibacterium sp.]OYY12079.1 MAG: bifunctional molybdenum cofactor biosynthesis protein MoaC/MoaB [Sphingobacteriia bacterium 35-36-14]OYZ54912.1 MAG: bifunctional molybdenum cofactor biosynthesis protein MoaC/MoaB [Sphingobacteriia bacterium 24-36-13]OZA66140.1 MAG: bifunctional molybdenum cofactor biosynthesis protein MoaC/MoaB [Sphingobacteriia bacterium 39-36-14]HQS24020.1 bifunctional molybdenum cofactor biosynthesis p